MYAWPFSSLFIILNNFMNTQKPTIRCKEKNIIVTYIFLLPLISVPPPQG